MRKEVLSPSEGFKSHSSPITLKLIAEQAGFAVSTVSHILGSRADLYAPATREKVLHIADKLGYRPNAFARAVRSGSFGAVSLLFSSNPAHSNISPPLIAGIHSALEKNELHMSLAMLSDEKLTNKDFVPRILREWMSDGLLIAYYQAIPERFMDLLASNNIPSVWINSSQTTDSVNTSNFIGGKDATEHLLQMGHKKIAFVDYTSPFPPGNIMDERYNGYKAAMESAGLAAHQIGGQTYTERLDRIEKSQKWLADSNRPTAVVCLGESSALPVISAAHINGLSIPTDLSVITFGSEPLTSTGTHITSMQIPFYDIGRESVAMLIRKMDQPNIMQSNEVLPFTLDQGATCYRVK